MISKRLTGGVAAAAVFVTLTAAQGPPVPAVSAGVSNADWPVYRGDPKGNQYAPLAQINADERAHAAAGLGPITPATRRSARRCTSIRSSSTA